MTAEAIAKALPKGHKSGSGHVACCPAHPDISPSLSLRDADDGKVLVRCHAGCSQDAVIAALSVLGLWPEKTQIRHIITAAYNYTDALGNLLYQVCRLEPKRFLQRYPDGGGGWIWKKHSNQVLYHLPEVLENPIVFVVEGEKDVEKLRERGFVATTNAGGAAAPWLPQFTEALRNREVILIPDRDRIGYERVKGIARALRGNVERLIYLELEDGKDVSEWFERGHSEEELLSQLQEGVS
jgi:putative DNA primase/helicase